MIIRRPMTPTTIGWLKGLSIPSEWTQSKVKYVAPGMQAGESITAESIDPTGTYPVYGGNGLRGYTEAKTHEGTCVLIGRQGALCGNVHLVSGEFWASEHAIVARPSEACDPRWLAYLLHVMNLGQYSQTAAQPGIGTGQINPLSVPLPPSLEQRAIADYLDRETTRIDTLIKEQQRLIEMLCERRASVVASVLTPTDSWRWLRIKHIGQTCLGKMLDAGRALREGDEPRPYVRAADVRADGSVNLVDLNEMPFSETEMGTFDLRVGDVLLIEGGATVGRPGFMFEAAPGIAFQKTVNRLRVGPQADARFVYWSMLRLYESAYYANHYGSVSFVHLTGEKLREIALPFPPVDEQRQLAAHLDETTKRIDTLIAETERFIEFAHERRSALITAAVTGQIDIHEAA
ncbi:restriction endonuclease subunit S [Actinomadura luteofluorescens]|uniref:restriction endonuclease subunit S n=1 Tax=Actinomadura luteofluorescens TaxID=46163 RepID=UPI00346C115C